MAEMLEDSSDDRLFTELLELFQAGPVAVLTGAGISTDSSIPDYRGEGSPRAGRRKPMNISQFRDDEQYRQRFWAGARIGSQGFNLATPNSGHLALAQLEAAGYTDGVITQNVDGLHSKAGSHTVVELHGSGATIRCMNCAHRWSRSEVLHWFDSLNPGFAEAHADAEIAPDGDALVEETAGVVVPLCPGCGGMLRPDVVYFGELVPRDVFAAAEALLDSAGALLLAGTSLAVNTGIRLVNRAEKREIPIGVINRGPTAVDRRTGVTVRIEGGTSETLAAVAKALV